jgi:hypothetical protein
MYLYIYTSLFIPKGTHYTIQKYNILSSDKILIVINFRYGELHVYRVINYIVQKMSNVVVLRPLLYPT